MSQVITQSSRDSKQEGEINPSLPLVVMLLLAIVILILSFCLEVLIQYEANIFHLVEISIISIILSIWQLIEVLVLKIYPQHRQIEFIRGLLILQISALLLRVLILLIESWPWREHSNDFGSGFGLIPLAFSTYYIAHFVGLNLLTLGFFSAREQFAQEQLSVARTAEVRLRERERILHELHDGFGSQLVAARIHVQRKGLLQDEAVKIFNECIADLHLIVDVMKEDVLLLHDALVNLWFRLDRRLQNSALKLRVNLDVKTVPLISQETIIQILRIVQEAISNAMQHSGATEIELNAVYSNEQLLISISDNGRGFDESVRLSGNGVRSMKRRAKEIGAQLDLKSDHGAIVQLRLKLDQEDLLLP